jgi:hypothetical protein
MKALIIGSPSCGEFPTQGIHNLLNTRSSSRVPGSLYSIPVQKQPFWAMRPPKWQ